MIITNLSNYKDEMLISLANEYKFYIILLNKLAKLLD